MGKRKSLWHRDVGQLFAGLFKNPMHALIVGLLGSILITAVFWFEISAYQQEHDSVPYLKQRKLYISIASVLMFSVLLVSDVWIKVRKKRRFKRYLERIDSSREGDGDRRDEKK